MSKKGSSAAKALYFGSVMVGFLAVVWGASRRREPRDDCINAPCQSVSARTPRAPPPRHRRGPPARLGRLCRSRSGDGNANCGCMAKRCEDDAIALSQLNEALTSRLIKIPLELK